MHSLRRRFDYLLKAEREKGRKGERQKGRKAEREKGRKGERQKGRKAEREKGRKGERQECDKGGWNCPSSLPPFLPFCLAAFHQS
jgi:hypothetical protein